MNDEICIECESGILKKEVRIYYYILIRKVTIFGIFWIKSYYWLKSIVIQLKT